MVEKVETLLNELRGHRAIEFLRGPASDSTAVSERNSFSNSEWVMTVYSQSFTLLEVAEDHAFAFVRCMQSPTLSFSCWTNVRGVLESSALSAWLMDPEIDAVTRVQRSLAFRYEGLSQQLKLLKIKGMDGEHERLAQRIDSIEIQAIEAGYDPVNDRNGRRIGIGQTMPPSTEIIEQSLGVGEAYRLLSAVAHGHSWALMRLGMKEVHDESLSTWDNIHKGTNGFQKHIDPTFVAYLVLNLTTAITKAMWSAYLIMGLDRQGLRSVCESHFTDIGLSDAVKFWRQ